MCSNDPLRTVVRRVTDLVGPPARHQHTHAQRLQAGAVVPHRQLPFAVLGPPPRQPLPPAAPGAQLHACKGTNPPADDKSRRFICCCLNGDVPQTGLCFDGNH